MEKEWDAPTLNEVSLIMDVRHRGLEVPGHFVDGLAHGGQPPLGRGHLFFGGRGEGALRRVDRPDVGDRLAAPLIEHVEVVLGGEHPIRQPW